MQVLRGALEDRPHDAKAIGASLEPDPRLVPVFGGQPIDVAPRHVRRVAEDHIVAARAKAAEHVAAQHSHAPAKSVQAHVRARNGQRSRRDVGGIDARVREGVRRGDRDAARARADIEDALHLAWADEGTKLLLDEFGKGRARHEHARIDLHLVPGEPRDAGEVGRRHALLDATPDEPSERRACLFWQALSIGGGRGRVRPAGSVKDQRRRLIERVVGAVAETQARTLEPTGGPADRSGGFGRRQARVTHGRRVYRIGSVR